MRIAEVACWHARPTTFANYFILWIVIHSKM